MIFEMIKIADSVPGINEKSEMQIENRPFLE